MQLGARLRRVENSPADPDDYDECLKLPTPDTRESTGFDFAAYEVAVCGRDPSRSCCVRSASCTLDAGPPCHAVRSLEDGRLRV